MVSKSRSSRNRLIFTDIELQLLLHVPHFSIIDIITCKENIVAQYWSLKCSFITVLQEKA